VGLRYRVRVKQGDRLAGKQVSALRKLQPCKPFAQIYVFFLKQQPCQKKLKTIPLQEKYALLADQAEKLSGFDFGTLLE
jgi:hypothetical protein